MNRLLWIWIRNNERIKDKRDDTDIWISVSVFLNLICQCKLVCRCHFLLNSSNYPITIAVRLKRMFNMLWFEYLRIMVGNIYQMYYMKSHWWWFLLLYSNISIAWLSESILAEKTIQFYSNIICNLDKFKRYW